MDARAPAPAQGRRTGGDSIFDHVLVGIDETPESLVGAAQAAVLRGPEARVVLLAVAERYLAAHAGLAAGNAEEHLVAGTSADLARAQELVDADDAVLASGRLVDVLCAECVRRGATLVVVGVRPHRRLASLTFGGHDVEALHAASCSLLIARPGWGPSRPQRIVVGVDGSPGSRKAEAVARALAHRLGSAIVPVVPLGGDVDPEVLRAERADALLDPGGVVDAVVHASSTDALIVVGADPGGGRRRGGDVAARIASAATCSVLVVRHVSDSAT